MSKNIQCFFWGVAAIAIGIYVLSVGERWLYQSYLTWEFAETLKAPAPARLSGVSAHTATKRFTPTEGQLFGRLEIPSIELSAMIAEGVGDDVLRRSVGHVPGTAIPGSIGNVGLSAHRDTFFRHLGKLQTGDLISVTTLDGVFRYEVESTSIVNPDESIVLRNIGRPTLTLVTCYPFYYVGPAPKRFVVHAGLAE
jgi:sortase A